MRDALRERAGGASVSDSSLLVDAGIHHDALRNDGIGGGYLESALEEADDAPDGDHDEDRDNAPEHDFQALMRALLLHGEEVFDEAPEKDDDGERDEKPYDAVEKCREENERVRQGRRRGYRGNRESAEPERTECTNKTDEWYAHRIAIMVST